MVEQKDDKTGRRRRAQVVPSSSTTPSATHARRRRRPKRRAILTRLLGEIAKRRTMLSSTHSRSDLDVPVLSLHTNTSTVVVLPAISALTPPPHGSVYAIGSDGRSMCMVPAGGGLAVAFGSETVGDVPEAPRFTGGRGKLLRVVVAGTAPVGPRGVPCQLLPFWR